MPPTKPRISTSGRKDIFGLADKGQPNVNSNADSAVDPPVQRISARSLVSASLTAMPASVLPNPSDLLAGAATAGAVQSAQRGSRASTAPPSVKQPTRQAPSQGDESASAW